MPSAVDINQLSESEVRQLAAQMQSTIQRLETERDAQLQERDTAIQQLEAERDTQLQERDTVIQRLTIEKEHLTHEIAILRRHRFGQRSEQSKSPQQSLLNDLVDEDLAAIESELEALEPPAAKERPRSKPRRQPLPSQLPRTEIHHDPESTTCGCGCQLTRIGEDVSEKLDYEPGSVQCRASHPQHVGLQAVRDGRAGADSAAHHRQGHTHNQPAGPGVDQQIR